MAAVTLTGASAGRPGTPFNLSSRLAADYASDGGARVSLAPNFHCRRFAAGAGIFHRGWERPSMIWTRRCLLQRLETLRETLRIQLRRRRVTYLLKRRHLRRRRPRRLVQYQQKPKNRLTLTNQHPPRLRVIPIPRAYQADRCRRLRAHLVLVREGVGITSLQIVDAGPSSGISWMKLKYKILGPGSQGYQYSADLSPQVSGGWTAGEGSTWDATYDGSITIDFKCWLCSEWIGSKSILPARD